MIVLIGFMGAGKTTVGALLAEDLRLPFVDLDSCIEQREAMSVAEIFQSRGEPYFRSVEREVADELLSGPEAVVALGGGALGDPGTTATLEWAQVVHLEVGLPEVLRRLGDDGSRPLMQGTDVRGLYEARLSQYRAIADVTVNVDGRTPEVVAKEVARALETTPIDPPATSVAGKVRVPLPGRAYDVHIGAGLAARAADAVGTLPDAEKAFLVTHPSLLTIADRVAQSLSKKGLQPTIFEIPEGEASKDLSLAAQLYESLAGAAAHRHDLMVAVGGGVVGDLTGYVASTFARGMPWLQVPTSLLAQVDAAVGGKTGVNLRLGKNLVGTIHQPTAVVCDVSLLEGLPDAEFRSGLAEVVKYGFIADPSLLDLVELRAEDLARRDARLLHDIVSRSVEIKAAIVARDERETGERAHLNYGHTFAHALEQMNGFSGIRHGEAVALGMVAAALVARELGWLRDEDVDRHRAVLASAGLPTSADLRLADLEERWIQDKKYRGGVRFVLLRRVGSPVAGIQVDRTHLESALEKMSP